MRINKNRTSKLRILMLIAFCLPIFSAYTFAQGTTPAQDCTNSNICSSPATTFRLMTSFIKEMVIAIKTIGTRDPYVWQYVSPSRFQNNEFVPPKQGLTSKLMRNIKQKLQSILAVSAVFTDLTNRGGVKDVAWWFIILTKGKIFLRDYKTLMEVDTMISDKKYELWLWGWRTDEVWEINGAMFQKIIDKYGPQWEGLFVQGTTINQYATYRQITTLMMRMNSSLKVFLATPGLWTWQFKSEFTKTKLINSSPDIHILFNKDMINAMWAEYQCAWDVKCDDTLSKFFSNISKIWKTFGSWATDALKTITDATKRFSLAMWGGWWKSTTPEEKAAMQKKNQELLRSQFWLKTKAATTWWFGLKNYRDQFDAASKKLSDGWKDMQTDLWENNQRAAMFARGSGSMTTAERRAAAKEVNKEVADLKSTLHNDVNSQTKSVITLVEALGGNVTVDVSQYADIKASMDALYVQAADMNESAIVSDNSDVTYPFFQVLEIVRTTIDQVIWNRNSQDKNNLINNLWNACEAQCANLWGKCFY